MLNFTHNKTKKINKMKKDIIIKIKKLQELREKTPIWKVFKICSINELINELYKKL